MSEKSYPQLNIVKIHPEILLSSVLKLICKI